MRGGAPGGGGEFGEQLEKSTDSMMCASVDSLSLSIDHVAAYLSVENMWFMIQKRATAAPTQLRLQSPQSS